MLSFIVEHAFAGLWTLVWHFGLAIGFAVLFAAAAYFSPVAKAPLVACALICLALFGGEVIGVRIEKARCNAQAAAVTKFVGKVVKSTTTKKSRTATDPWDSPKN